MRAGDAGQQLAMRLFTSAAPPGIAVPAGNLPRPWAMPAAASTSHRRALALLLADALRPFEPDLWLVEVPWVERESLARGSIRLPPSSLVWWQVDRYAATSAEPILAEGSRIAPGYCLFDFAGNIDVPAEAWLGPLKMAVLHRLVDRLLDERPVAAHAELADALGDLARKIVSPIDLMDAADLLLARALNGLDPAAVTEEVLAIVVSRRSRAGGRDQDLLRHAARFSGDEGKREGGPGERDPLLEPMLRWIDDPKVASRVVRLIGKRVGMAPPVVSLAEKMVGSPASLPLPALSRTAAESGAGEAKSIEPAPPVQATALRQAVYKSMAGDKMSAADTLLSAIRRHEDSRWTEDERRAAAHLLLEGALLKVGAADRSMVEHAAALAEAAADCAATPLESATMIRALLVAAECRLELGQRAAFSALLRRAEPVLDPTTHPGLFIHYAEVRTRAEIAGAEASDLARRLWGVLQASGGRLTPAGKVRTELMLGILYVLAGNAEAESFLQNALNAARREGLRDLEENAWFSIGHLAEMNGDLRRAARAFEAAVVLSRSDARRVGLPDASYRLGNVALEREELVRALEAFEEAQEGYALSGDRPGEARALAALANALWQQSLAVSEADDEREANALLVGARAASEKAVAIVRTLEDKPWLAELLLASGWYQGDAEKRRGQLDEARRLFEDLGDRLNQALATEQVAQDHQHGPSARPLYEEASRLYLQAGNPEDAGRVLVLAGLVAKARGDLIAARSAYSEAARIAAGTEIADDALRYLHELDDTPPPSG